ncbi:hypothetical protein P9597_08330 [Aneurinibacillus migulanus]|nr:hypothetical protein [Aneurinibacillus migulanus]
MNSAGILQVNVHRRNNDFIIDIIDTGIGMPFYYTKEEGTRFSITIPCMLSEYLFYSE